MFKYIKHLFCHDFKSVVVDFDSYENIIVIIQNGKMVESLNKKTYTKVLKEQGDNIFRCWCGMWVLKSSKK